MLGFLVNNREGTASTEWLVTGENNQETLCQVLSLKTVKDYLSLEKSLPTYCAFGQLLLAVFTRRNLQ